MVHDLALDARPGDQVVHPVDAQQGALAAAGRPDERGDALGRDRDRDVLHGAERSVVDAHVLRSSIDRGWSAWLSSGDAATPSSFGDPAGSICMASGLLFWCSGAGRRFACGSITGLYSRIGGHLLPGPFIAVSEHDGDRVGQLASRRAGPRWRLPQVIGTHPVAACMTIGTPPSMEGGVGRR